MRRGLGGRNHCNFRLRIRGASEDEGSVLGALSRWDFGAGSVALSCPDSYQKRCASSLHCSAVTPGYWKLNQGEQVASIKLRS